VWDALASLESVTPGTEGGGNLGRTDLSSLFVVWGIPC